MSGGANRAPDDLPRPGYAWFTVGVLLLASVVSYVDRQIVAIVVAPMKADLHASDSEIGWLYGVFALFFALGGLPLAMLADRYSRTRLIAAGVAVWSALTATCGVASSFGQVLLARIGVGVGEAVLTPAANSLIADCFPRPRIPFAISVFTVGSTVGSGLAFVVGGFVLGLVQGAGHVHLPLLGQLGAWQQVFVVCGLPGLLLVPVVLLVREPRRRYLAGQGGGASLSEILAFYRANRATLALHHLGFLCFSLMGFGFVFWSITFFSRVHGMPASTAAQIFGWLQMIFASLGSVWAPTLAARLARRGRRDANLLAGMAGGALAMVSIILIQPMPTVFWAWVLYVPALFFVASPFGLAYGSLPVITPPPMRAVVTAGFMLVVNLGMLLGPPIAGLFNERIFPGPQGVRWSLLTLTPIFGVAGLVLLAFGRRHYGASLEAADRLEAARAVMAAPESPPVGVARQLHAAGDDQGLTGNPTSRV
jgi:MFS family permease